MIVVSRGEIWFANLNPTRGSEQAGIRPVIVFQANVLNKFTTTVLTIPLTTNIKRASFYLRVYLFQKEKVALQMILLLYVISCVS